MGIKKMFMKKDPTEEELREDLNRVGISTKSGNTREEKFGAFKNYAQERAQMRPAMAPSNPYAKLQNNDPPKNPYASGSSSPGSSVTPQAGNGAGSSSPYSTPVSRGGAASNPYGSSTRYGQSQSSDPYAAPSRRQQAQSSGRDSYSRPTSRSSTGGTAAVSQGRGPAGASGGEPLARVSRVSTRQSTADTESLDLNAISSHQMFHNSKPVKKQAFDSEELDLNEEFNEEEDLDLNLDIPEEGEQVNSEDEEVEAIKQDIRFVKQESVQSTRNTLRMAQEADASGTNTLGMLGSQSERLYNAEQNLLLADTQTQIADEKVKELRRLNRSIFIPAYGNPFNKKSRLRQQEENIKNRKMQEKYLRETNRQNMYESEQRLKQGIMNNATDNDVHHKYQNEKYLQQAQRYQFENDSEDDEVEKEIAGNLDQIGSYAKKLHGIANTMGKEIDSQNVRLRKIEEDADKLDINVHMNSTRLSNIR
ncbi:SEC9 [Candida theae]|uniref:SEC9 n=1 Tax=Candida theae TaxID=1198502 RepID=A0AAD5BHL8_9ASCO|nr:SEC9 [Candida theae]KAI5962782.1 SEC9 [Candida theae]